MLPASVAFWRALRSLLMRVNEYRRLHISLALTVARNSYIPPHCHEVEIRRSLKDPWVSCLSVRLDFMCKSGTIFCRYRPLYIAVKATPAMILVIWIHHVWTVCRHRPRMHLRCLYLGGCWNANFSVAITTCANWYTVLIINPTTVSRTL